MKSVLMLLSVVVALAGCSSTRAKNEAPANSQSGDSTNVEYVAPDSKGIQTLIVRATAIPEYLDLPAHIEADPTLVVHVFAPAGGRIVEMKVRPWDHVEKGQTLAALESGDLARAVAEYRKALADDQVKQSALVDPRTFLDTSPSPSANTSWPKAMRSKLRPKSRRPANRSASRHGPGPRLDAPFCSRAPLGSNPRYRRDLRRVLPSARRATPLCTIADITTVWAMGDIYEKDLSAAKQGEQAQVTLNAYPNEHWTGRVSVVSRAVDPVTRTLHVRVVLPNPAADSNPQCSARSAFFDPEPRILVPTSAVIREGNNSYLFVSQGNGRLERRAVKIGRALDGSLEIIAGVNEGDAIVSDGALLLRSAGQG